MSELENNTFSLENCSDGLRYIAEGYVDYSKTIITERALANIYDGLKPVHRRIMATLHGAKSKSFIKSQRAAGDVLALHPHGDAAVYQAMVLMTDRNGSLAFPLLEGSGNWGHVYSNEEAAAPRYTEVRLHPSTETYFGEMNGIEMIPNFDSTEMEPTVLPVSFPAVLVNSSTGIAVGFRSNIPSFNFNDVCDLVIEYIKDGHCHTVIEPDFVTGGYYVRNEKELQKIMRGGSGKIKLRGKHIINGKQIVVTEVPYGKTIQKLIKATNDLNSSAVRNAYDSDDYDSGALFTVDCTSKAKVDEALYQMYKNTDFQYTYSADITVIKDGAPVRLGVWGIIEEWVKWRRLVLLKEYKARVEALKTALREAIAFMNVVNSYEKRMELVHIIADSGRAKGREYVRDNFTREEVPEDLIDFVAGRSLPSYYDGGKYAPVYATGQAEINSLLQSIDNIDEVIVSQMNALKARYGGNMKRRTEVTTKDYSFVEEEKPTEKFVDTSYCRYEFKNGFLKKLRYPTMDGTIEFAIDGTASETLIAFDNRGRLLRVYCQDIPLCSASDFGTYLPSYFGLEEDDDYKITWLGKLDGSELMLLYKDGNVGFVDTSEWIGNSRNVKVLQKGISVSSAPYLGAVIKDIPNVLFVTDEDGRIAWAYTRDIKRKDRTAKTRVFDLARNTLLDSWVGLDEMKLSLYVNNVGAYCGRLRHLNDITDFRGDESDFTRMM